MSRIIDSSIRFWNKVNIKNPNDCWEWAGAKIYHNYGFFRINKYRNITAHRYSYILTYGEIQDSLVVCHKCDNPSCVNPNHLFLGTRADNSKDMVKKNRQAKGKTLGIRSTSKLTEKDVLYIRNSPEKQKDLARMFNIDPSTISGIKSNKRWGWVK